MNRRKFFSKINGAVVGIYLGCHVKPIDETQRLMAVTIENPAWVDAPYELAFLYSTNVFEDAKWRKAVFPENLGDPIRFIRK